MTADGGDNRDGEGVDTAEDPKGRGQRWGQGIGVLRKSNELVAGSGQTAVERSLPAVNGGGGGRVRGSKAEKFCL